MGSLAPPLPGIGTHKREHADAEAAAEIWDGSELPTLPQHLHLSLALLLGAELDAENATNLPRLDTVPKEREPQ